MTDASSPAAPPRSVAWGALVASGVAMMMLSVAYLLFILSTVDVDRAEVPAQFWRAVAIAGLLTLASLGLRSLRWTFLLRRSQIRIPTVDSVIGYVSGLSLLFAPLLIGEMAVRAVVHRTRAGVPVATTCVITLWERCLDVAALTIIAAVAAPRPGAWRAALAAVAAVLAFRSLRELALSAMIGVVGLGTRVLTGAPARVDRESLEGLVTFRAAAVGLAVSVIVWTLPAIGLWGMARAWGGGFTVAQGHYAYAASSLAGWIRLAPGGVVVVGAAMLDYVAATGLPAAAAALTVASARIVTAGLATILGALFALVHFRSRRVAAVDHFDVIADQYAAQIPEARRLALLSRKTQLMQRIIRERGCGSRGLDVGCGQGWYVARMRELGFDVHGIDDSAGQVEAARRYVGDPSVIERGSMLDVPAPDASFDFVYCINVLHHLPSREAQRAAFVELQRILRPGGLLFVHEINTRNALFRFYMGYIFPALNCIDEGVERWLLPHRLGSYTSAAVVEVDYFTFLPDFLPEPVIRLLAPLERLLERSRLQPYSAHYMAVIQKAPAEGTAR